MKKLRIALLAGAVLAASSLVQAQQFTPGWYIGAGAGVGSLNRSGSDLTGLPNGQLDDTDTTYTVRTGFRFSPYWAIELGYYDLGTYAFSGRLLGSTTDITGSFKAKSVGLSFVGILPIDRLDLYGRIGYARSELKANASASFTAPANAKDKESEATYAVGARYNFGPNWGVFAEWVKNDKIRVDSYLAGVDFRF